jgi:hypothetical protein
MAGPSFHRFLPAKARRRSTPVARDGSAVTGIRLDLVGRAFIGVGGRDLGTGFRQVRALDHDLGLAAVLARDLIQAVDEHVAAGALVAVLVEGIRRPAALHRTNPMQRTTPSPVFVLVPFISRLNGSRNNCPAPVRGLRFAGPGRRCPGRETHDRVGEDGLCPAKPKGLGTLCEAKICGAVRFLTMGACTQSAAGRNEIVASAGECPWCARFATRSGADCTLASPKTSGRAGSPCAVRATCLRRRKPRSL